MTGNDCLPNMQALTSCFQHCTLALVFSVPWIRGVACCLLGFIPGISGFFAAHRA